ncbi:MAG: DUF6364 family protein [Bacteroidota bacterium]
MSTKLTLTLDKNVIEQAKQYAKNEGRSLSNLIEDYLKVLITSANQEEEEFQFSPIVSSLKGAIKLEPDQVEHFNYKEVLEQELLDRYNVTASE